MKRFYWSVFSVIVILMVSTNPVFAAPENNVSAQKTVTASAVIVPAQVSEMGFLISGIVRDIPVKEGDRVKAGQTLMVLDTPDLRSVSEAKPACAAQAEVESKE
jgi:multidrug efflux pump subunit AcrA (membrane-fusion protein)